MSIIGTLLQPENNLKNLKLYMCTNVSKNGKRAKNKTKQNKI